MLLSLRTKAIELTLDYLKSLELPGGSIAAWRGGQSYPEVTGYSIPTLFDLGETTFALRCSDWLLKTQKPDGSFVGLDGVPRTFDTAACMEGLLRTFEETGDSAYSTAATSAAAFIATMRRPDGLLRISPETYDTHLYLLRVMGLMGYEINIVPEFNHKVRTHYLAYALEGLLLLGKDSVVRQELQSLTAIYDDEIPYYTDGSGGMDVSATAQIGILCHKTGLPYHAYLQSLNHELIQFSWAAKFYLDFLRLVNDGLVGY